MRARGCRRRSEDAWCARRTPPCLILSAPLPSAGLRSVWRRQAKAALLLYSFFVCACVACVWTGKIREQSRPARDREDGQCWGSPASSRTVCFFFFALPEMVTSTQGILLLPMLICLQRFVNVHGKSRATISFVCVCAFGVTVPAKRAPCAVRLANLKRSCTPVLAAPWRKARAWLHLGATQPLPLLIEESSQTASFLRGQNEKYVL